MSVPFYSPPRISKFAVATEMSLRTDLRLRSWGTLFSCSPYPPVSAGTPGAKSFCEMQILGVTSTGPPKTLSQEGVAMRSGISIV